MKSSNCYSQRVKNYFKSKGLKGDSEINEDKITVLINYSRSLNVVSYLFNYSRC